MINVHTATCSSKQSGFAAAGTGETTYLNLHQHMFCSKSSLRDPPPVRVAGRALYVIRSTCYGILERARSLARQYTHPVRELGVADHLVQEGATEVLSDHVYAVVIGIHTRTSSPASGCQHANFEQIITRVRTTTRQSSVLRPAYSQSISPYFRSRTYPRIASSPARYSSAA